MYLVVSMKIEPYGNVDVEEIKKLIEDNNVNLPFHNLIKHNDRSPLGKVREVKVECYPKEPL